MLRLKQNCLPLLKRLCSTQVKRIRHSESSISQTLKYNVGEKLFGYTIKQVEEVPELQLAAVLLNHDKTGTEHLHVAREDKNNVFSVALRTTPGNSKGIMHILEHLALCGSQKFSCRDPFFKMMNRSLATFMNAYTGTDFTMYIFSTQNSKDYENLFQVYSDAVFFPCLREEDFRQEAWRLEHQDVNDTNSPIVLKGVVFNEMKGVFSDSNQMYARCLLNKLFPTTYCHESGGDPIEIPNLTWKELREYHAQYYHPSNCRFFTYGDLPLVDHLQAIEEQILNKFSKINVHSQIENEILWNEARNENIGCRFDPMAANPNKQTTLGCSYLLNDITDTHESFTMSLVGNLLTDGPNSPFYRTLLESGLGPDYSPWTGHEGSFKRGFFSVGLREISKDDVELVKSTIDSTIADTIRDGFPQKRVEGVLHYIELALKHQKTNFGHTTALGINSAWNHGSNPIISLRVNEHVHQFQKQMQQNPHLLQDKICQYLKDNPHKLFLQMSPDENFEVKQQEAEDRLLSTKIASLTKNEKENLYNEGIKLSKLQEKKEDLSCLPTLLISDVERSVEKTYLQIEHVGKVSVQLCEQPTNGVMYFSAVSTISSLSDDLLMVLPLFTEIVTKMGAGDKDFKSFDQETELKTGGLSASVFIADHPSNPDEFELAVRFSSHCLQKNVSDMMNLWQDVFNRLTLTDKNRLTQLIKLTAADLSQSISGAGHRYGMVRSSSCLNLSGNIKEKLSGLSQVSFMKNLSESSNCDQVLEKLQILSKLILNRNSLRCSINTNSESMSSSFDHVQKFVESLPENFEDVNMSKWDNINTVGNKYHFVLPFDVNYVAKSIMTVPYDNKDFASLKIAAKVLSTKFLHIEIREKGGAYGGGSTLGSSGVFGFYSYRDPNTVQTLNSFDAGIQWILDGNYTDQDIDEAKLGTFSDIDQPVSPGSKGSLHFLSGITDDMKQQLRERLFKVTKGDIIAVTHKYLQQPKIVGSTIIGPEQELTKNNSEWIVHKE